MSLLTDVVHEVETTYDILRSGDTVDWDQEYLLSELAQAQSLLAEYETIFCDKLGRDGDISKGVSIDPDRIASWLDSIRAITEKPMDEEVKEVVSEAYSMLISLESEPLSKVIEEPVQSMASMAEQLGKPLPNVEINDSDVLIDGRVHSMLNNIFTHVLRNAVDHGIESAEERVQKGKAEFGCVQLDTNAESDFVHFKVSDDGRGIALDKIRALAAEKGIIDADTTLADQEVANLVFHSGFSTADQVSDLSGRGVGMDAVRQFLESEGGAIELRLTGGAEGDAFRAFETVISLPSSFYSQAMPFSKTA